MNNLTVVIIKRCWTWITALISECIIRSLPNNHARNFLESNKFLVLSTKSRNVSSAKLDHSDNRAYQEYLLKSLQDKYNALNNQFESHIRDSNTEITRSIPFCLGWWDKTFVMQFSQLKMILRWKRKGIMNLPIFSMRRLNNALKFRCSIWKYCIDLDIIW